VKIEVEAKVKAKAIGHKLGLGRICQVEQDER
jgi:hypothetical protein